jgi:hypothetical protein
MGLSRLTERPAEGDRERSAKRDAERDPEVEWDTSAKAALDLADASLVSAHALTECRLGDPESLAAVSDALAEGESKRLRQPARLANCLGWSSPRR